MSKIVQIRELLAEKFPGVRIASEPAPVRDMPVWPTGLWGLDNTLPGGLPRGALTELSAPDDAWGSALVLRQLIRQAAASHQWLALVDGADSFDPAGFDNATLEHLLWIRCANAAEAVKAADLILRDGNLPIVVLDLVMNAARELRKIPSSTWYRFQRLVEDGAASFLAITPTHTVTSAKHRIFLRGKMPIDAFTRTDAELIGRLTIENTEVQHELELEARHA